MNLIESKTKLATIRASTVLTTDYVAGTVINHDGFHTIILFCEFTIGTSAGYKLKIETSHDGITWFQEQQYAQAGGETTYAPNEHVITDTGNATINIYGIIAPRVRISVKAITATVGTLLKITAQSSNLERS
jgi:hypothetical protein